MKSGMISMVLFQMRFAFRWDITSLAYRIPYSLIVYLFWVHLIIFIPSMIELYCFSLDQGPCFAGFLEYSLTNALLSSNFPPLQETKHSFSKANNYPPQEFSKVSLRRTTRKTALKSRMLGRLALSRGNHDFLRFFSLFGGEAYKCKSRQILTL